MIVYGALSLKELDAAARKNFPGVKVFDLFIVPEKTDKPAVVVTNEILIQLQDEAEETKARRGTAGQEEEPARLALDMKRKTVATMSVSDF